MPVSSEFPGYFAFYAQWKVDRDYSLSLKFHIKYIFLETRMSILLLSLSYHDVIDMKNKLITDMVPALPDHLFNIEILQMGPNSGNLYL